MARRNGYTVPTPTLTVNTLQLFSSCTNGLAITDAQLTSGMIGGGNNDRWSRREGGSVYTSWFCANYTDTAFPVALKVGSTTYPSTGTNWMQYNVTNGTTENIQFRVGATFGSSTFTNITTTFFLLPMLTNIIGPVQLDLVQCDENPWGIIQIQTGLPGLSIHAHADGSDSASSQVISAGTLYYVSITQQSLSGNVIVTVSDSSGNLLKSMTGSGSGPFGSAWQLRFQCNYLNDGSITGWLRLGGVSISYQ